MACIRPDGEVTRAGMDILRAVAAGARSPEEVSERTALPLFRVRSGLRELAEAGYLQPQGVQTYALSPQGKDKIGAIP